MACREVKQIFKEKFHHVIQLITKLALLTQNEQKFQLTHLTRKFRKKKLRQLSSQGCFLSKYMAKGKGKEGFFK